MALPIVQSAPPKNQTSTGVSGYQGKLTTLPGITGYHPEILSTKIETIPQDRTILIRGSPTVPPAKNVPSPITISLPKFNLNLYGSGGGGGTSSSSSNQVLVPNVGNVPLVVPTPQGGTIITTGPIICSPASTG